MRGDGAGTPDLSGSGWLLQAYASVTNQPYEVWDKYGSFEEVIARGAFAKTLSEGPDVAFLINHEGLPLGRCRSGTLQLNEDLKGLKYSVQLDPANPVAVALRSAVNRGDASESSFAFEVVRQTWDSTYTKRNISEVSLHRGDVSTVTFGANPYTGDPGNATSLRSSQRAQLTTAQMNDLPDSAFAYIEPGGTKDATGKTVLRSKRHFCIVDAAHVRAALARIAQGAAFGKEATPAVLKAAAKFKIHVASANAATRPGETRAPSSHPAMSGTHSHNHPSGKSTPKTHSHAHTHNGDAIHSTHVHGPQTALADDAAAAAAAGIESGDSDQPLGAMMLSSSAELEARLWLLQVAGGDVGDFEALRNDLNLEDTLRLARLRDRGRSTPRRTLPSASKIAAIEERRRAELKGRSR